MLVRVDDNGIDLVQSIVRPSCRAIEVIRQCEVTAVG